MVEKSEIGENCPKRVCRVRNKRTKGEATGEANGPEEEMASKGI